MASKDNRKWHNKRHRIGDACEWHCHYCGGIVICPNCYPDVPREYMATLDHYHPKSLGGGRSYENLVMACGPCNQDKDDHILTGGEISNLPGLTYSIGTRL
jgi:5-methylcytosine-specific restriction endonuclease McrA